MKNHVILKFSKEATNKLSDDEMMNFHDQLNGETSVIVVHPFKVTVKEVKSTKLIHIYADGEFDE